MSEEFANRLLRVTVAQLLLPLGWHNITNTSVEVLGDVMRRYIESVGKTTSGYATHANRQACNLDDLALAFDDYLVNMPGLQEYLDGVDQLTFPSEVHQFPAKRSNKHVYESSAPPTTAGSTVIGENLSYEDVEEDEALSPLIPAYLPPLPTKEETEKVDDDDDRESGIHISDGEEMELGGGGSTPMEGQFSKGLPGMASSGRRGRTFSTDSDMSSEHDDIVLSNSLPVDVSKQLGMATMPTRVVPHRINPIRLSEAASPDPVVMPTDDEVSISGMSLDDSSLDSDKEIDVDDKKELDTTPPPSKKKKKAEVSISSDVIVSDKKNSRKQLQKPASAPSPTVIAKSEAKEATSGPYKPTVSSKLLTRFTLAQDIPTGPLVTKGDNKQPQGGRLPEPPVPPLNLKSVPRETKVSLSSLSPLSSDISSPRSPPVGNKNMQLALEKFPMESPTKRSYRLDNLPVSPISPSRQDIFPTTAVSLKEDATLVMSPVVSTNSEYDDSDNISVSALSPKLSALKDDEHPAPSEAVDVAGGISASTQLGDKQLPVKGILPKPVAISASEKLLVSINRRYINLPHRDVKPLTTSSKKKAKSASGGLKRLLVSLPKKYYFLAVASQQKSKRPSTLSPAAVAMAVKHDRKSKVKSEQRAQPMKSQEVELPLRLPIVTPTADASSSQPIKLRFKLGSDVVGGSSISPDVSKEIKPTVPKDWPIGGHSSRKRKRKHKKEKKKKKKRYQDSDSSSDSEGIYSEGNSAKDSPITTGHILPPLPPLHTTVLPYQPTYPLVVCPTCKLPDDGRPMIACDICDQWFHWACVNVTTEPSDGMDWYCLECSRHDNNTGGGGSSSSKRRERKHKKKKKHLHDHD